MFVYEKLDEKERKKMIKNYCVIVAKAIILMKYDGGIISTFYKFNHTNKI